LRAFSIKGGQVDRTENQTDNLQGKPGLPSDGDKGTSKETPTTYTQEQIDEIVTKAKSDAIAAKSDELAAAGRDAKSIEVRETAVKAREDANKAEQDRRDAADLAEAQKDPDKLAAYQSKKAEQDRARNLADGEAQLARDKADHAAAIKASQETDREILIFGIAQAKGVDLVRLKTLADKLKIEGKEQLEELAKELATGKPKKGDPNFEADNALTKGGGSTPERAKDKIKAGWEELHK
jgi:hypothetical protein